MKSRLILANYDLESWMRSKIEIVEAYGEKYFQEELARRNAECEIAEAIYMNSKKSGGNNGKGSEGPSNRDTREIR